MNLLFFEFNSTVLAEGEGFEPRYVLPHAGFQDRYLQTTRSPFRTISEFWRRRGDSNPRYRSLHTNDLANRPPSATWVLLQIHYLVYHISAIIDSFIANRV